MISITIKWGDFSICFHKNSEGNNGQLHRSKDPRTDTFDGTSPQGDPRGTFWLFKRHCQYFLQREFFHVLKDGENFPKRVNYIFLCSSRVSLPLKLGRNQIKRAESYALQLEAQNWIVWRWRRNIQITEKLVKKDFN